jgi:hypothetical protein
VKLKEKVLVKVNNLHLDQFVPSIDLELNMSSINNAKHVKFKESNTISKEPVITLQPFVIHMNNVLMAFV